MIFIYKQFKNICIKDNTSFFLANFIAAANASDCMVLVSITLTYPISSPETVSTFAQKTWSARNLSFDSLQSTYYNINIRDNIKISI